jgi:glycosyltransferase involved in cell wall biosynthesis
VTVTSRSLSVVLPAYNEEENIGRMLEQAAEALPAIASSWEVVVVDDGSRDRTSEVAAEEAHRVIDAGGSIRILRHVVNRGYGAAIRTGFEHASSDLLFYTDADCQFDLGELKWFVPLSERHELVVGFRVYRYDTVLRSITSWCYNRLVTVLFRVRVRDVDCAYKLLRRDALEKIDIECDHFFVDTELVAKARRWNLDIAERGVRHYPRTAGATTVHPSDVIRTLKEVGRMWLRIYFPTIGRRVHPPDAEPETTPTETVEVMPVARAV